MSPTTTLLIAVSGLVAGLVAVAVAAVLARGTL